MSTVTKDIHFDLIESCKRGNHQAFAKLYQLYAKAMYNVALRIIKVEEEAQDILQDSFIKAYHKINQFEYQANFGAWLKRIVINQALDCIRKKKVLISDSLDGFDIEDSEDLDWQTVDFTVERIKKALMKLPDGFRIVCSMYLFEGFEHKEIAQVLGISESTSKTQYHRGKIKLKEILQQYEREER